MKAENEFKVSKISELNDRLNELRKEKGVIISAMGCKIQLYNSTGTQLFSFNANFLLDLAEKAVKNEQVKIENELEELL